MVKVQYVTSDGKVFDDACKAIKHDREIIEADPLYKLINESGVFEDGSYEGFDIRDEAFIWIKENWEALKRVMGEA